jgi:hypothetical protein
MVDVATVLLTGAAVVAAGSLAAIAVMVYYRFSVDDPPGVWQARLEVYGEIMDTVIRINKLAVEFHENDRFIFEQEKYVMDDESKFEEHLDELTRAEQRGTFIISTEVRDAVSEYVDYFASYHKDPRIEEVLHLGGEVARAMRRDLRLSTIETETDENQGISGERDG